jgi:hypothetical protein
MSRCKFFHFSFLHPRCVSKSDVVDQTIANKILRTRRVVGKLKFKFELELLLTLVHHLDFIKTRPQKLVHDVLVGLFEGASGKLGYMELGYFLRFETSGRAAVLRGFLGFAKKSGLLGLVWVPVLPSVLLLDRFLSFFSPCDFF